MCILHTQHCTERSDDFLSYPPDSRCQRLINVGIMITLIMITMLVMLLLIIIIIIIIIIKHNSNCVS